MSFLLILINKVRKNHEIDKGNVNLSLRSTLTNVDSLIDKHPFLKKVNKQYIKIKKALDNPELKISIKNKCFLCQMRLV